MTDDSWAVRLSAMKAVVDGDRGVDEAGIHRRMGQTLIWVQDVERTLRFVLTFVIQKGDGLTLERLEAQTEAERKKTIGYFLDQMRRRVAIHPKVNDYLSTFLTLRNRFAHDVSSVPGWDMETEDGLKAANDFLTDLGGHSLWVYFWLAGIVRGWSLEVGMKTGFDDHETMHFLDRTFRPLADATLDELPE